jgi:hypothetical protein
MDVFLLKMQLSLFYIVFTLYKTYIISTELVQISNDAKLIMRDGAYKDLRGPYPRHP